MAYVKIVPFFPFEFGNVFIGHFNDPVISIAANTYMINTGNFNSIQNMVGLCGRGDESVVIKEAMNFAYWGSYNFYPCEF